MSGYIDNLEYHLCDFFVTFDQLYVAEQGGERAKELLMSNIWATCDIPAWNNIYLE